MGMRTTTIVLAFVVVVIGTIMLADPTSACRASVSREDVSGGGYYDMTCKCGPHTNVWSTTASCSVLRFKDSAYEEEMYHQQNSCKKCCQDKMAERRRSEERYRASNRRGSSADCDDKPWLVICGGAG